LGFKKWVAKKNRERQARKRDEQSYKKEVDSLLFKFEIPDLDDFFDRVIGERPDLEYEEDEETGKKIYKNPLRREYLDFVWKNLESGDLTFQQLKDFALRNHIVPPSFFGIDSEEAGEQGEFEKIMNSIKANFQPEKITKEEHLEAQLTIFLKAKFPDLKVERQITTKSGDQLDILVSNKFVFEIKVPKNRTDLRNLGAQLEEYKEEYPNLCAIIADISNIELDENEEEVETNLTQNIQQYADRYKIKHGVPSLVFNVVMRK